MLFSRFKPCSSNLFLGCTKCFKVNLTFVCNAAFGPVLGCGF
jgi:hypothetical protein